MADHLPNPVKMALPFEKGVHKIEPEEEQQKRKRKESQENKPQPGHAGFEAKPPQD
jgi:hypothetical protein